MVSSPSISLKPWIDANINPCAPEFKPMPWNDGMDSLRNYRAFLDTNKIAVSLDTPDDLYDHIDEMLWLFLNYDDDNIADYWKTTVDIVEQWEGVYGACFRTVQYTNNCYSYARNDPAKRLPGSKPHVGYKSEAELSASIDGLLHAAEQDQLKFVGTTLPSLKDGFYAVALFICPDANDTELFSDFHWMREDRFTTFSQKIGFGPAKERTDVGAKIIAPHDIDIPGFRFQGYFYAPA